MSNFSPLRRSLLLSFPSRRQSENHDSDRRKCALFVRSKSGRRTKRSRNPNNKWRVVVTRDVFSGHRVGRGKQFPSLFFISLVNPSSLGSVISSKTRVTRKRRPHSFTDDYNNNGDHERRRDRTAGGGEGKRKKKRTRRI